MLKNTVHPAFEEAKNAFVFATNDIYAPYLGVALLSFIEHTSPHTFYDVCILYTDVSVAHRQAIQSLQSSNISIRFVDMTPFLAEIDTDIFVTHVHFTKEAYYRFFIPHFFAHYEKVLYMDCDMIFLADMQALFAQDMRNKPLAAVLEYKFKCKVEFDPVLRHYAQDILCLHQAQNYFNSGLLLFDIAQLIAMHFTEKCLETLRRIQKPRTVDQCVLNSLMQGQIFFLDAAWNLQTHVNVQELKQYVPAEDYTNYVKSLLKPKVIHYCSPIKPWNTADIPLGKVWWQYAKKSIFVSNY